MLISAGYDAYLPTSPPLSTPSLSLLFHSLSLFLSFPLRIFTSLFLLFFHFSPVSLSPIVLPTVCLFLSLASPFFHPISLSLLSFLPYSSLFLSFSPISSFLPPPSLPLPPPPTFSSSFSLSPFPPPYLSSFFPFPSLSSFSPLSLSLSRPFLPLSSLPCPPPAPAAYPYPAEWNQYAGRVMQGVCAEDVG